MHTTTKGALAAGAAAVLLLGGAGSLAYWSDSAVVNGGDLTSGSLSIDAVGCDADWVYAAGNASAGAVVTTIVPGDSITKACEFTVGAVGDNILAQPTIPPTVAYTVTPSAPSISLAVGATYQLDGVGLGPADTIDSSNDGDALTADIVVTFPFGTAAVNTNDTQNVLVELDDLTVSLTQLAA